MTWVKLDDTCPDHPSIVGLSDAAFACWVRSLCYASRHLTDGFVPRSAIRTLGTAKAAKELLAAGRWEDVEGGVRVRNYGEKQRTREQVEAERERWRQRQTRHRGVTTSSPRDTDERHAGVTRTEVEVETEVDDVTTSSAARGTTATERQQRIEEACRTLADERAALRDDVGPGWAPAAARGLAQDHHQALHAHLVADPDASRDDLIDVIEGQTRPARPEPVNTSSLIHRPDTEKLADHRPPDHDTNAAGIAQARAAFRRTG